jgi:uncharacterized DUF497 family protein
MAARGVYSFEWDDINREHLWERHHVADLEVDQLLSNLNVLLPNKRKRARRRFLIGETHAGRVLVVVIEPTRLAGTWRPIAAWDADGIERRRLKGKGQ